MEQQRLGRYQLVQRLAAGGMAEVFLARAEGPGGFSKQVVVKRVLPHLASDPSFVQMFLGEARLAALFSHPHVVQTFDFGEAQGAYFLAMEYVDGPTLRALASAARKRGTPVPAEIAARLVADAAGGLAYVHALAHPETHKPLGLVHRDVSPENILVSRAGVVKVVDFGVAKAVGEGHRTKTAGVKGKLAYMAPEQLASEPLDGRADVYALGVTLYELLSGELPHEGDSDATLMKSVLFEPAVPLAQRCPGLPAPLLAVVERALARKRESRFSGSAELQAALEQFLRGVDGDSGARAVAAWVAELAPPGLPTAAPPSSQTGGVESRPVSSTALAFPAADLVTEPAYAAVLFTDIVGSTRYFEKHGDAAGLAMVQRHNALLFPVVTAHGGRVVKTIGDAILAVFPEAGPAVAAACRVHEVLAEDAAAGNERIRVRAGVHAGTVLRHADDVFGDVVNTAARVSSAAHAGEVLVSRAVVEALPAGSPRPKPRPALTAKGKQAPVEVFAAREADGEAPDAGGLSYVPCLNCGAPLRSEGDYCDCQAGARLESEAAKYDVRAMLFDMPGGAEPAAPTAPAPPAADSEPAPAPSTPPGPALALQPPEKPPAEEAGSGIELGFDPRKRRLVLEAQAEARSAADALKEENPDAPAPAWRPKDEQVGEAIVWPPRKPDEVKVRRRRRPWKRWVALAALVLLLVGGAFYLSHASPEELARLAEAWLKLRDALTPAANTVKRFVMKGTAG